MVDKKKIDILTSLLKDNKNFCIVTHPNADLDAVASTFSLKFIIKKINKDATIKIIFPQGINSLSKKVLKYLEINEKYFKEMNNWMWDICFLVDTNNLANLNSIGDTLKKRLQKVVLIDHHESSITNFLLDIVQVSALASSIIMYEISKAIDVKLPKKIRMLLIAGIIDDTNRFSIANPRIFKVCYNLLKEDVDYLKIMSALQSDENFSKKMARLKALQRMKIYHFKNLIIATTYVSAYESFAADTIIKLGADLALVASKRDSKIRIISRSSTDFYTKTGINLGADIMPKIGDYLHGEGGGHAMAGGASGFGDLQDALSFSIKILSEKLK